MLDRWIILLVAIGLGGFVLRAVIRRVRSYRRHLSRELEECGCAFVASRRPRHFDTGPFPAIEVKRGGLILRTPLGGGTFSAYRIVTFRDSNGRERESWAMLEFETFLLRRIRWSPGLPRKKANTKPRR